MLNHRDPSVLHLRLNNPMITQHLTICWAVNYHWEREALNSGHNSRQTVLWFLCNIKGQILDHHKIPGKRPTCGGVPDNCCRTASLPLGHSTPAQPLLNPTTHTCYHLLPKCAFLVKSAGYTPANTETLQKIYSPSIPLGGQTMVFQ